MPNSCWRWGPSRTRWPPCRRSWQSIRNGSTRGGCSCKPSTRAAGTPTLSPRSRPQPMYLRCALGAGTRRLDYGRDRRQHRPRPGRAAPASGDRPRKVCGQPPGRRARRSLPGSPARPERRRRHRARPLPAGHPGMAAGRRLDAPVGHDADPHRSPDACRRQPRRGHLREPDQALPEPGGRFLIIHMQCPDSDSEFTVVHRVSARH